jgi:hypothetical protein
LLFIRPARSGAPHAKNNAKAMPKDLIDVFQMVELLGWSPRTSFGIFLTARA